MISKTFRGGIHPKDMKYLSSDAAIKTLEPTGKLVFPVNQHIGALAVIIVNKGDRVLVGSKIAEKSGFVSSDIFSSVSGTVTDVGTVIGANGLRTPAVTVENDGLYEKAEGFGKERNWKELSCDEIKSIIFSSGIVGMGGAGFPTGVKLSVKEGVRIDHILCNGAECEPYITCDYRLMLERAEKALTGMAIVMKLFDGAKGVFGIENNKPAAIAHIRDIISRDPDFSSAEVCELLKKYPQGGERMLIRAVTGREINSKMLPSDAGCVVLNFSTLIAIADAVCYGIPLIRRVVTVTGDAINQPSNFDVPIGMNMEELIEAAGGFSAEPEKIISGGPMMGLSLSSAGIPITKTSSCILLLSKDASADLEPTPCIRCGKCLDACPEGLMPIKLKALADKKDYDGFEKLNGLECINCGSCTYVCPAKRRLSESISTTKGAVLAEKKKKTAPGGGRK